MGDMSATVPAVASQAVEEAEGNNFLIPNGTFFVVLVIFLIVLGVIGTFVVPPIMRVLHEREIMVTKTLADNKKSAEQVAAAQADYEKAMSQARVKASAARDDARAEGRKIVDYMRARTEEQVASTLQNTGEQLKREGDAVATDLRSGVDSMSATLASRILGVDITSTGGTLKTATTSGSR
jgi:F-type H+-transporting ATPase subunit b